VPQSAAGAGVPCCRAVLGVLLTLHLAATCPAAAAAAAVAFIKATLGTESASQLLKSRIRSWLTTQPAAGAGGGCVRGHGSALPSSGVL
jgi:hypothetical protein